MNGDEVSRSLDRISKILAGILLKDIEDGDQRLKIKRLNQCGFSHGEIATMVGTTADTVKVTVHSLKKNKRKSSNKKK